VHEGNQACQLHGLASFINDKVLIVAGFYAGHYLGGAHGQSCTHNLRVRYHFFLNLLDLVAGFETLLFWRLYQVKSMSFQFCYFLTFIQLIKKRLYFFFAHDDLLNQIFNFFFTFSFRNCVFSLLNHNKQFLLLNSVPFVCISVNRLRKITLLDDLINFIVQRVHS